jgi:hypothetical protein
MSEFTDPVLGKLTWSADDRAWQAEVAGEDAVIRFLIAGKPEPEPQLLAHARDIAQSLPDFLRLISEFLEEQAQLVSQQKGWLLGDGPAQSAADEIRQLAIDTIHLPWPDRPNDGMIYFTGPADELRLWRCDYIDRKPTSLGCDT